MKRRQHLVTRLLAVALALPMAAIVGSFNAAPVAAAGSCSSHASLSHPPSSIRVLTRPGRVITVPFRRYVVTVMGKEWPSYLPQAVVEAGAVAVKQYAWYHTVYSSRSSNGRCFDVKDGTSDQLYKPSRARIHPDHYRALDATWNVSLRKNGRLFMTGYRRGDKVACGRDATGYKLFARSAVMCARSGLGFRDILRKYYNPGLTLVGSGGDSAPRVAVPAPAPAAAAVTQAVSSARSTPRNASEAAAQTRQTPQRQPDPQPSARPAPPPIPDPAPIPPEAVVDSGFGGGAPGGVAAAILERELMIPL